MRVAMEMIGPMVLPHIDSDTYVDDEVDGDGLGYGHCDGDSDGCIGGGGGYVDDDDCCVSDVHACDVAVSGRRARCLRLSRCVHGLGDGYCDGCCYC